MYRGLVVLVFARTFDDGLASLVKEIDRVIGQNPEKRVGSYVNFLGDDLERLKSAAAEFGRTHRFNHVPLVVPGAFKEGPERMRIDPAAQLTVIIYELRPGRVVLANHALAPGRLDAKSIEAIIADIEKHLR